MDRNLQRFAFFGVPFYDELHTGVWFQTAEVPG